ncbi:hypothetical protein AJ88_30510 [Mesorhizobium amorphae CCBAU 01583]|nr:hypothetical protein AJ88_30510 [Mesorhizobium amorphae CCBAU 01583]
MVLAKENNKRAPRGDARLFPFGSEKQARSGHAETALENLQVPGRAATIVAPSRPSPAMMMQF